MVSLRSRRRKFDLFMRTMRPRPQDRVVDVGAADSPFGEGVGQERTHNFLEALYPWPERITAVGLVDMPRLRAAFPQIRTLVADGRALPFGDGEFEIGFSNAVVEHVGDRNAQRAFVHELCRVARRVFLTTPNRWFPVDPHTLVPFAHWLSARQRDRVYRTLRRGVPYPLEPLGPSELRALFPGVVRILNSGLTLVALAGEPPPR